MNAAPMRLPAAQNHERRRLEPGSALAWLLVFGLVAYLGLDGGGYDPLVHDQVGILVWWIVLAGVAVAAFPLRQLPSSAWAALGLLVAFAAWTALSLTWTESTFRTGADLARVCTYVGIFIFALLARGRGELSRLAGAVGTGIALVALVALLSRLQPAWFPDAGQTAVFIEDSRERLAYPINYWNGLAALIAIGVPLLLQTAAGSTAVLLRALAAAALPALALTSFFTLSRAGIVVAAVAIGLYLALASDRLPKLLSLIVAGTGAAALIVAATGRDALREGLATPTAQSQGDDMLLLCIGVCLAVGLVQTAIALGGRLGRPRWTVASPRLAAAALAAGLVGVGVLTVALDAPGRAADGWDEFREGGGPGSGTSRLDSVAGQGRYDFWQAAVDENATRPLTGTGSGTFELWWARNGTGESVRDTHSLYLQVFGELGIVGLLLLAAFLLLVLFLGVRAAVTAEPLRRSWLAAVVAGCVAFFLTAVVDWMWQIPVLVAAMLILAALLAGERRDDARAGNSRLPVVARIGVVVASLLAIAAISIPLATVSLLRESEASARAGDLDAALAKARSAQNVQPGAAAPRLQEALVLERRGDLALALDAVRAAVEREPKNWRNWLVLSRIHVQLGHPAEATASYRRARSLNPLSAVFER